MKHVLFLSYDGMTDPLGQSQVIPYLKGLTVAGYRFTILSCDKPSNFLESKDQVFQTLQGFPINWVSIPYHKNPPVLSSLFDVLQMRKKAAEIHSKDPVDMVHTRPGIPPLVALWMKKKFGVKYVNDIRGFWADERVDGGMWNLRNPVFKMIYKFFKAEEDKCI
ncbi:MAG: glycosyltransferase, partial [Chitinophagaceae bacterium]